MDTLPTWSDTLLLNIRKLGIVKGKFKLDNFQKSATKTKHSSEMDYAHMEFNEINLEIDSFSMQGLNIDAALKHMDLKSNSDFNVLTAEAEKIHIDSRRAVLEGLYLETNSSRIKDRIEFRYRDFASWQEFTDKVIMDISLKNTAVAVSDIVVFAPALKNVPFFKDHASHTISANGNIIGRVNRLAGKDLDMRIGAETVFIGDFNSRNLSIRNEEILNLNLARFETDMVTLRNLIPDFQLPANFYKLGHLKFNGTFDGYFENFVAFGNLETDLGNAQMDMQLNVYEGKENAKFSGHLELNNFDLGEWTGNPDFGLVSINSDVRNGKGLTPETVYAELSAYVSSFEFKGYSYDQLDMSGFVKQNTFDGDFEIHDDNLDFTFKGLVEFGNELPNFDFKAQINQFDLQALNILEDNIAIHGGIDVNFTGLTADEIFGTVKTADLFIVRDDSTEFLVDSLILNSTLSSDNIRKIQLRSDLINANMVGIFSLEKIMGSLINTAVENYPTFASKLNLSVPDSIPLMSYQFDFEVLDMKNLAAILDKNLIIASGTIGNGYFDNIKDTLSINVYAPELAYDKYYFNHLDIVGLNQNNKGNFEFVADSFNIGGNTGLPNMNINLNLEEDKIDFGVQTKEMISLTDNLNLEGIFEIYDGRYQIRFKPSNLEMFKLKWKIDSNNFIQFDSAYINAKNLNLVSEDKRISFNTINKRGINANIQGFDLSYIHDFWQSEKLAFEGNLDLSIHSNNVFELTEFETIMDVDSLLINEDYYGKFRLNAATENLNGPVQVLVNIENGNQHFNGSGSIITNETLGDFTDDKLDLNIEISDYPVKIGEYFLGQHISNTSGVFDANLTVTGNLTSPQLNGNGNLNQGFTRFDYLGAEFSVENQDFKIYPNYFDLTNILVEDKQGNVAYLIGGIGHTNFKEFSLDVNMTTSRFLVLNTTKEENPLYYGKCLANGVIRFSGTFKLPNIDIEASTLEGSVLNIPVDYGYSYSEADFVRFVDEIEDTLDINENIAIIRGLSLNMELEVDELSEVRIIFDERRGEVMQGRGIGYIDFSINRAGQIDMNGIYEIRSGKYLFALSELFITKPFEISDGGTLVWDGDPLNAKINIEAIYKKNDLRPYNFLEEYLVSDQLKELARQTTEVDLIMNLTGILLEPEISFDISFPRLTGELKNYADSKIRSLRSDPNELNRNVFYLLVTQTFPPSTTSSVANTGIATGINTLSEFISSQLSLFVTDFFADVVDDVGYISNVELDFYYGLNSDELSAGNVDFSNSQFQLAPSIGLFDDRVTLKGGVKYIRDGSAEDFLGGEVLWDWAITEDRRLKLKAYFLTDQTIEGRKSKFGGGISYRQDYVNMADLLSKIKQDLIRKK